MASSLKLKMNGEIRLVSIPTPDEELIAALHQQAHELFHIPADKALRICTQDADGDYLTLATPQEVHAAISQQLLNGRQVALMHVMHATPVHAGGISEDAAAAEAVADAADAAAHARHPHHARRQEHARPAHHHWQPEAAPAHHHQAPAHGCGGAAAHAHAGWEPKWHKWAHHVPPHLLRHMMRRWAAKQGGCGEW